MKRRTKNGLYNFGETPSLQYFPVQHIQHSNVHPLYRRTVEIYRFVTQCLLVFDSEILQYNI